MENPQGGTIVAVGARERIYYDLCYVYSSCRFDEKTVVKYGLLLLDDHPGGATQREACHVVGLLPGQCHLQ